MAISRLKFILWCDARHQEVQRVGGLSVLPRLLRYLGPNLDLQLDREHELCELYWWWPLQTQCESLLQYGFRPWSF